MVFRLVGEWVIVSLTLESETELDLRERIYRNVCFSFKRPSGLT